MNPVGDVIIAGQALESFGLVGFNNVEGLSLNTFGFLFPCAGIWSPADPSITTTWADCTDPNATLETCSD